LLQACQRFRPDARQHAYRQRVEYCQQVGASHDDQPVRLVQIGRDLCDQLVRCNANRRCQRGLVANPHFDLPGDIGGAAEQVQASRNIEKCFVQRQALDKRREFRKYGKDLP
jgi:hypothetical protein